MPTKSTDSGLRMSVTRRSVKLVTSAASDRPGHEDDEEEEERQGEAPRDQRVAPRATARPWTAVRPAATALSVAAHGPTPCRSRRRLPASSVQPSSGDMSPTVTCSMAVSISAATSSQVEIAGGAFASWSWSPKADEQLVTGQRLVVPRRLDRWQVADRLVPGHLHLGLGQVLDEGPACLLVVRVGQHGQVAAADERRAGLLGRLVRDRPGLRIRAGIGHDADHPRSADERADVAVGELALERHVARLRAPSGPPRRRSRRRSAPRRTPRSRA